MRAAIGPIAAAILATAAFLPLATPLGAAELDDTIVTFFQVEQLEIRATDGNTVVQWDLNGWIGNDDHRLALKSEGESVLGGGTESVEIQLLYRRPISDFFDLQAGVRHDPRPEPERTYRVLGVQGLAPLFVETDASLFVSETGDVSVRLEAERDFLFTQRLILQPSIELNLAFSGAAAIESGSGINDLELGLRLRYEIKREFAPYVGLHWERKFGGTADFARADGKAVDSLFAVAGLRFWF